MQLYAGLAPTAKSQAVLIGERSNTSFRCLSFLIFFPPLTRRLAVLEQLWKEGDWRYLIFSKIFLAGQLVFAHWWLTTPLDDAAVSLQAATVGSYKARRSMVTPPNLSPYSTLEEPTTPTFIPILNWTKFGIKKPTNVIHNGALSQFDGLKSLYQLPNSHLFQFISSSTMNFGLSLGALGFLSDLVIFRHCCMMIPLLRLQPLSISNYLWKLVNYSHHVEMPALQTFLDLIMPTRIIFGRIPLLD